MKVKRTLLSSENNVLVTEFLNYEGTINRLNAEYKLNSRYTNFIWNLSKKGVKLWKQ